MSNFRCPVCECQIVPTIVINTNSKAAADHFVKTTGTLEPGLLQHHIENLWNATKCQILRCSECGSRFAEPHIAGDSKFYDLAYPGLPSYPDSRWEFDLTAKLAASLLKDGDQVLEIGAGSGAFVKQLLKQGLDASRIVVTEFSLSALADLRMLGVQAKAIDFRDGIPGDLFRVIVLFQTLEHLDKLDVVLNALNRLGTDDSHIFISVPNVDYVDWAEKNLGPIDMPPNHITAFSATGLEKLFRRNGWLPVDIQFHNRYSLVARYKFGAMRGLSYPSGRFQGFLNHLYSLNSSRFGKILRYFLSGLVILSDWSLMRAAPPEDIWIHVKRDSIS